MGKKAYKQLYENAIIEIKELKESYQKKINEVVNKYITPIKDSVIFDKLRDEYGEEQQDETKINAMLPKMKQFCEELKALTRKFELPREENYWNGLLKLYEKIDITSPLQDKQDFLNTIFLRLSDNNYDIGDHYDIINFALKFFKDTQ